MKARRIRAVPIPPAYGTHGSGVYLPDGCREMSRLRQRIPNNSTIGIGTTVPKKPQESRTEVFMDKSRGAMIVSSLSLLWTIILPKASQINDPPKKWISDSCPTRLTAATCTLFATAWPLWIKAQASCQSPSTGVFP